MVPCALFEDSDLLVVNKPAGLNTHSPAPYAGEGLYDWLRHREPRWAALAIIHRLDKETSGLIVFAKTQTACRSLTDQFTQRQVRKRYVLLTDRQPPGTSFTVRSSLARAGEKYMSRAATRGGQVAQTRFRLAEGGVEMGEGRTPTTTKYPLSLLEAEPLTGRTHQIRVHAAEKGIPIVGDELYGGTSARRLCLHAAELAFKHPVSGEELCFHAPVDFSLDEKPELRAALIDPNETDAFRLIHGASDGWAEWYVDSLDGYLLSQAKCAPSQDQLAHLQRMNRQGVYHRSLTSQPGRLDVTGASPQLLLGKAAPERFTVRENGLTFELSTAEGYSTGLFLDQRDNRRRLLTRHIGAGFPLIKNGKCGDKLSPPRLLNTFAYTCGFSVCAAKAGLHTTSVDLSKKYLEWGKRNLSLNGLDPREHEFIYGDVFDWLGRLAKKNRSYHVILLDPPTFSRSKSSGSFRAEKDFSQLVRSSLFLLQPGGVLFCSSNAGTWPPEAFVSSIGKVVPAAGRKILQSHYTPQPPDFPISRSEPAYLKTLWLRIA